MNTEPGAIYIVQLPFTDLSGLKRRPVLALNKSDKRGDFVSLAITSQSKSDHIILIEQKNLKNGVMPKTSYVRVDKIFTLNTSIIEKQIAAIEPDFLNLLKNTFCTESI